MSRSKNRRRQHNGGENPGRHLALRRGVGDDDHMRHESRVTSLSWIPSEAVTGAARAAFDTGLAHYDNPPPGKLGDLEELRAADQFRFANVLRAWIDVDDTGRVTGCGYAGDSRGLIGSTTIRLGGLHYRFQAVKLPDLQTEPERRDSWVRFTQTVGGRTGAPMPRRVRRRPFVQWQAPTVWTALSLTLHADGKADVGLTGASRFPRHWVYGPDGMLAQKSGLTEWEEWYRRSFGPAQPLGRRGLAHARYGGGDGTRARALGAANAWKGQAEDRAAPGRHHPGPAR